MVLSGDDLRWLDEATKVKSAGPRYGMMSMVRLEVGRKRKMLLERILDLP